MQAAPVIRPPQGVPPGLVLAVSTILQQEERLVEEHLLRLRLADVVLLGALAGVAVVPVEALDPRPVDHGRMVLAYTAASSREFRKPPPMPRTWYTADLHLGHEAITRPSGRPFRSAAHMDAALIENLWSRAGADDALWIAGDFTHAPEPRRRRGDGGRTGRGARSGGAAPRW